MARVEIYRLKKGGTQEIYAICNLVDDTVICEGNTEFVERMKKAGILDRSVKPPEQVLPSDGKRFLEVLKTYFDSGYLVASDVLNGD